MPSLRWPASLLLAAALSLPACAGGRPAGLQAGWNRLAGGAGTQCSDGSPYAFYVRPADPQRLLIHLQGGGACWSGETCDPKSGPYRPSVSGDPDPSAGEGIFEFDNSENPFSTWTIVFVPYCTGDVHLGDRTAEYTLPAKDGKPESSFTIHHNGWRNLTSSLDWTFAHLPRPQRIFVTGTSAGSISSPIAAALVADHYPRVPLVQLGDGSGGYRSEDKGASAAPAAWNLTGALPAWDGLRGQTAATITFEALYLVAARRHPEIHFATYDSAEDEAQRIFLKLGGAGDSPLLPRLQKSAGTIAAGVPHFSTYVAGGMTHTLLPSSWFYTYVTNGIGVRDWVAALAAGKPVANVHCQDCARPELRFTAQDVAILERADQLLAAQERWSPNDPSPCPQDPAVALGLGCALERASREITGRSVSALSARAALEDLRYEVGTTGENQRVGQRLGAWNNAEGRSFAEVKALLARELARAKAALAR